MKSLITFLLFTTIVFHSQGQSTTFFKSDQINFQNKKFRLFGHEDIEQNIVQGHNLDKGSQLEFRLSYYDKNGVIMREYSPKLGFDDVSIFNSSIGLMNELFLEGKGDSPFGRANFSCGFQKDGRLIWKHADSLIIGLLKPFNDSDYYGRMKILSSHSKYDEGDYMVEINDSGQIKLAIQLRTVVGDSLVVDAGMSQIRQILFSGSRKYILFSNKLGDQNAIAYSKNDGISWEIMPLPEILFFQLDNYSIFLGTMTGRIGSARYLLKQYTLDLQEKMNFEGEMGEFNSISGSLVFHNGGLFSFVSNHTDSSWNLTDQRLNFYSHHGIKKRVCRYSLSVGEFDIGIPQPTRDNGILIYASPRDWAPYNSGLMKTDSLGLVYNTDVICDCKDYNTGIGEQ
ncbi:MAG: hypothetical protein KDC83_03955, partial [Flavobacteriales bacterium]|nr:hypothetical protein [Flavobacteriales bacterium]